MYIWNLTQKAREHTIMALGSTIIEINIKYIGISPTIGNSNFEIKQKFPLSRIDGDYLKFEITNRELEEEVRVNTLVLLAEKVTSDGNEEFVYAYLDYRNADLVLQPRDDGLVRKMINIDLDVANNVINIISEQSTNGSSFILRSEVDDILNNKINSKNYVTEEALLAKQYAVGNLDEYIRNDQLDVKLDAKNFALESDLSHYLRIDNLGDEIEKLNLFTEYAKTDAIESTFLKKNELDSKLTEKFEELGLTNYNEEKGNFLTSSSLDNILDSKKYVTLETLNTKLDLSEADGRYWKKSDISFDGAWIEIEKLIKEKLQ